MKTRIGNLLLLRQRIGYQNIAHGNGSRCKKEIDWLVENGPKTGLFFGRVKFCPSRDSLGKH